MMKKHPKARQFALSAVASALLTMPAMAENVNISQQPLVGVANVKPAVVLALSVEYPTAGVAYSTTQSLSLNAIREGAQTFDGYFDAKKCYTYIQTIPHGSPGGYRAGGYETRPAYDHLYVDKNAAGQREDLFNGSNGYVEYGDGYFKPTSDAKTIGGYQGLCEGSVEWSGNMMNFMTMSAVDIMRKTLTGGNRAKGVGSSVDVYQAGDATDKTYLRRATQWGLMSDTPFDHASEGAKDQQVYDFSLRGFDWDVYGTKIDGTPILKYLLPHNYYDYMLRMSGGRNGPLGKEPGAGVGVKDEGWGSFSAANSCKYTGLAAIAFMNNGTGFNIGFLQRRGRYVAWDRYGREDSYNTEPYWAFGDRSLYGDSSGNGNIFTAGVSSNVGNRVNCGVPNTAKTESDAIVSSKWFNVVVEQEKPQPEGLLQQYALGKNMRVAAMGYLSETDKTKSQHDGGALRAKMKSVVSEINDDGTFKINPEGAEEGNSGVINYVNKFGDSAPYDINDVPAELYYSAIRYLRNGAWRWNADGSQTKVGGNANPFSYSKVSDYEKDGFPVYDSWDDPLKAEGDEPKDMQCYAPSIILLGDTNTHDDNNLPNYPSTGNVTDNVGLDKNGRTLYYQKVCELSGFCTGSQTYKVSSGGQGPGTDKGGPNYAPTFGMAGMAYWVKTNDVRPDIVREDGTPTHIQSFIIDVLEGGYAKTKGSLWSKGVLANDDSQMQNAYYLAGKFASPDYEEGKTYTRSDFDSTNSSTRSLWTNDAIGKSSSDSFPLGVPKNYAVANDPQNMKSALEAAFKTVGIAENTMQSGIQYNNGNGAELNLSAKGSANLLAQGYIKANKEVKDGKEVITYTVTNKAKVLEELQKNPKLVPLTFRAGYNTTNWTGYLKASVLVTAYQEGDAYGSAPMEAELWDAGSNLFAEYHKSPAKARKVESKAENTASTPNSGFVAFDAAHASSLDEYITGAVIETVARDNNGNKTGGTNYYNQLSSRNKSPANLINYLLGDSTYEGSDGGFRVRSGSLMGTSVYSSVTPILQNSTTQEIQGVPIDGGKTCRYAKARSGDYVATASNEGMLHIFDMEGNEKYAYVPQTALPYIANFASPNYEHRYVNDGTAVLHEVCDGTHAATYLVGTSGRGGSSIYAINVTDDKDFKAALEVNADTDSDIGILVSAPIVANQAVTGGNGDPVIIFSSGYNNSSGNGHLFIYNLKTGSKIAKIPLGSSGVGSPTGYDSNNDGIIDRIYVGDYAGKLYRISMTDPVGANATWGSCDGGKQCVKEVFTAEGPILNRPAIGQVGNKTAILLGTGTYLHLNDMMNTKQNYAYGIFDDGTAENIATGDLLTQTFTENKQAGSNGNENLTFYEITQNKDEDDTKKGWRLVLPKGYTITSDSAFYGPHNEVAIYTATKAEEGRCGVTGDAMLIAVDSRNGGAYERPIFDVNNDYKFNDSDAPNGYTIGAVSTGFVGLGGTIAHTNLPVNFFTLTSGKQTAQAAIYKFPSGALRTRRVSWREVF